MSKITYANKVAINENAEILDINKVTDSNMNEIKAVVNNNDDEMITINTNLTNATTYSTDEIRVGTWMGKPLYRKVFTGTLNNSSVVSVNISELNCEICYFKNGFLISAGGPTYPIPYEYGDDSLNTTCEINISQSIFKLMNGNSSSSYTRGTYYIILEYTKTTD